MKKNIKVLAAVMAVSVAVSGLSVSVYAANGFGTQDTSAPVGSKKVAGGWELNDESTSLSEHPDAKKALSKAKKKYSDGKIEPIAYLGSQVVAGTNYCYLCRTTGSEDGAKPEISIVYVYLDLKGNAKITGFQTIVGPLAPGGFKANTGKFKLGNNKNVKKAFKKAVKGLTGFSYEPIAYLGSQVVSGSNYLILVRGTEVYPGAEPAFYLATIYADLKGNAKLNDVQPLELGSIDTFVDEDTE